MLDPDPELASRLERLTAVQRELWKLQQQWSDDERRRTLTEAALEALRAVKRPSAP